MTWLRVSNQNSSEPGRVSAPSNADALPEGTARVLSEGSKIKVLIADDHKMITDVFSLFLSQEYSMDIDTAESLEEATLLIKQKRCLSNKLSAGFMQRL